MTVDEAIRDLLALSSYIRQVAVLGPDGGLLGAGPGAAAGDAAAAGERLWGAAAARAAGLGDACLDHVVVHDDAGAVAMAAAHGRRIAAVTGPRPAVGLLLFDLRTCLSDAFAEEGTS